MLNFAKILNFAKFGLSLLNRYIVSLETGQRDVLLTNGQIVFFTEEKPAGPTLTKRPNVTLVIRHMDILLPLI